MKEVDQRPTYKTQNFLYEGTIKKELVESPE